MVILNFDSALYTLHLQRTHTPRTLVALTPHTICVVAGVRHIIEYTVGAAIATTTVYMILLL